MVVEAVLGTRMSLVATTGSIQLKPQAGGFYVAESKFLPLVALGFGTPKAGTLGGSGPRATAVGCAGAICALEHAVFWDFRAALTA